MTISSEQLLTLWQSHHGDLTSEALRRKFLRSRDVAEIRGYSTPWITATIAHEKKLEKALQVLKLRAAMRFEIDSLLAEIAAGKPKMRWHPGTRILRQHDDPFVELDIVGESYCKASFDELRGKYEAKNSSRLNMIVELLIDPDNKFS